MKNKKEKTKVETNEISLADAAKIKRDNRIKSHGRVFEGKVTSKHDRRIAIEFERAVYVRKYERYAKSKTKIHARLPEKLKDEINIGDLIKVQECRPLSKIIHFVVLGKVEKKKTKEKEK